MKNILPLFFLVFACSSSIHVVESDYSYKGRFNAYRHFNFVQNSSFSGTDNDKVLIEKSLTGMLESWGYERKSRRPDLLVYYTLYFEDVNFKGYNQPDFISWVSTNFNSRIVPTDSLGEQLADKKKVRKEGESYNNQKLTLNEGTVLISFYDTSRKMTVWQGYASGVFGPNRIVNERTMKSVLMRIMDQYKLLAYKS